MICFSYICIITKLNAKFPIILPPRQTKPPQTLRQRGTNELKKERGNYCSPLRYRNGHRQFLHPLRLLVHSVEGKISELCIDIFIRYNY